MLNPALNFKLELIMLAALTIGAILARQKYYRAHGFVQGTVVLLNLVLIATVMAPSPLLRPPDLVTTIHAALGGIMELLGIYVVLVAATSLLPKALRFNNYKPWMRTLFVGWWLVVGLGVVVYGPWGSPKLEAQDKDKDKGKGKAAEGVTIKFSNFKFEPKEVTVKPGTTVTWINEGGKHTINADTDEFKSPDITSGGKFEHKFTKPGDYAFYCKYHGDKGGVRMSGVVHVKP